MRVAAIDIGTVTCRLLVADVVDNAIVELSRQCTITNLGIGVDKTGILAQDAIERVVNCIAGYKKIIESFETEQCPVLMYAIATSASRDAENSSELVDKLEQLGITLNVIPGTREAVLSFMGASCNYPGEQLLVVDIGGGSTEIIFGEGCCEPEFSHSFNIGCRRVTERFLHDDPPTKEQIKQAQTWIKETMKPKFEEAFSKGLKVERIVAVAGTATTSVSVHKKMAVYNSKEVDRTVMDLPSLQGVYNQFCSVDLEQRKKIVGLEPDRASVIIAGMIILLEILDLCEIGQYTVSESDILQGIVMSCQD